MYTCRLARLKVTFRVLCRHVYMSMCTCFYVSRPRLALACIFQSIYLCLCVYEYVCLCALYVRVCVTVYTYIHILCRWVLTKSWILNNILAFSLIIFFLTSVRYDNVCVSICTWHNVHVYMYIRIHKYVIYICLDIFPQFLPDECPVWQCMRVSMYACIHINMHIMSRLYGVM